MKKKTIKITMILTLAITVFSSIAVLADNGPGTTPPLRTLPIVELLSNGPGTTPPL